jgi:hypothetical protein
VRKCSYYVQPDVENAFPIPCLTFIQYYQDRIRLKLWLQTCSSNDIAFSAIIELFKLNDTKLNEVTNTYYTYPCVRY